MDLDVAIVGGGPAGSTVGTLLRKYNNDLRIGVLEKEKFPRDHIGESQLPYIARILVEMGCWDKVEAAGFPIKVGGTYRWGQSPDLWDFDFVPHGKFSPEPRPNKYQGQRIWTAWQVDRARYDKILLDHAREHGCDVHEETAVVETVIDDNDPDRIDHLVVRRANGETEKVRAEHYVDASGGIGALRKHLPVEIDSPTSLQNVAFWDYWDNAEWAVEIGVGGTRVQVLSIGTGWLWFIPLGPSRASIGFVCPASFYKNSDKSPAEIYAWAMSQQPRIQELIREATARGQVEATKDWSFLADRLAGDNWFLAGESAGFADPILAGGMTLAHSGARHCAYCILEMERGTHDPAWLRDEYSETERRRINQHIRFADYWYAGNGQFTDLQEFTTTLAADAGLTLNPEEAFRWLSTGGFTDDYIGAVGIGGQDIAAVKQLTAIFGEREELEWNLSKYNKFELDLEGTESIDLASLDNGRIERVTCYTRKGRRLPTFGLWGDLIGTLRKTSDLFTIYQELKQLNVRRFGEVDGKFHADHTMQMLEVMTGDGWVRASIDPSRPRGRHFKSTAMTGNFGVNSDDLTRRMAER